MILDRDDEFRATVLALYVQELGRPINAVSASELEGWVQHAREGMTGEEMRRLFHDSNEGVAYRAYLANPPKEQPKPPVEKPPVDIPPVDVPPPPIRPIQLQGIDIVDSKGQRIVLSGTDQFCAYQQYLAYGDSVLLPLFRESRDLGFNLWRIFMMGSSKQNNILDLYPTLYDTYYSSLRPFILLLNAWGITPLLTVFVDAQDVMPNLDDQLIHWSRLAAEVSKAVSLDSRVLVSGGNEYQKNHFTPNDLPDPGPLVAWSRGSGTADEEPVKPYASFVEFHPRRDLPKSILDSVASPVTLYEWGVDVPLIIDEPIGFADVDKPGSRSNDPRLAYRLARHYSTECAGAVFHNDSGMRGKLMTPKIRECAVAWQAGMRL